MPYDFKKEYPEYYMPANTPRIVNVPEMRFASVQGQGDPNAENGAFRAAMQLLYGISYTIKMSPKADHAIEGYYTYVVPPLEGLWWMPDGAAPDPGRKAEYCWTALIRLPDFVTQEVFAWARGNAAAAKKKLDASAAEYRIWREGLCVQCMYIGGYDGEPETLARMDGYARDRGYRTDFTGLRRHHEIYLSDPGKTAPEKQKTVLRHPICQGA